jgi:hypothetical protein
MLFLDLERRVQRRFGDSNQVFITEADIIDWTNDGQLAIVRETRCLTGTSSAAASTFPVNKPTDFLKMLRITYNGMPLSYVDIEELDARYTDLSTQDVPILWYIANDQIALYPDPTNTDSTSVVMYYSKVPTTIAVNSDPLTIPTLYQVDLISYVLMRAHERNENWMGYDRCMADYTKGLAERMDEAFEPEDTYFVKRDDGWDNQVQVNNGW